MIKRIQGNTIDFAIRLRSLVFFKENRIVEKFTVLQGDVFSASLYDSKRYNYPDVTIDTDVDSDATYLRFRDNGELIPGVYTLDVRVERADGTRLRSLRPHAIEILHHAPPFLDECSICGNSVELLSNPFVFAKGDKGDKGDNGLDGKSAYEIALDNGFVGTAEEWLESLKIDMRGLEEADANLLNLLNHRFDYVGKFSSIDALLDAFRDKAGEGIPLLYGELASGDRITHRSICMTLASGVGGKTSFAQYIFSSSTKYGVGLWTRRVNPDGSGGYTATSLTKVGSGGLSLAGKTLSLLDDAGVIVASVNLGSLTDAVQSPVSVSRNEDKILFKDLSGNTLFEVGSATETLAGVMTPAHVNKLSAVNPVYNLDDYFSNIQTATNSEHQEARDVFEKVRKKEAVGFFKGGVVLDCAYAADASYAQILYLKNQGSSFYFEREIQELEDDEWTYRKDKDNKIILKIDLKNFYDEISEEITHIYDFGAYKKNLENVEEFNDFIDKFSELENGSRRAWCTMDGAPFLYSETTETHYKLYFLERDTLGKIFVSEHSWTKDSSHQYSKFQRRLLNENDYAVLSMRADDADEQIDSILETKQDKTIVNEVPFNEFSGELKLNECTRIVGEVSAIKFRLPAVGPDQNGRVFCASCTVFFRTNSSPALQFSTVDNKPISLFDNVTISGNTDYEFNFMYNGERWILAHGIIA